MARNFVRLFLLSLMVCAAFFAIPDVAGAQATCGPTVVVAPGDNLFQIAQRCGITVTELRSANPHVTDPTRLFVGTVLTIPQPGTTLPPTPPPTLPPALPPAVVAIFPASGSAGSVVTVVANGLPANAPITVGFGPIGAQPIITSGASSGTYGEVQAQTNLPPNVGPGTPWVVTLSVGGQVAGTSLPFTIVGPPAPVPTVPPTPGGTLFDRANIFLVALGDNGASGPMIGCQDSIIPVEVQFAPTVAPMTAAYQSLLSLDTVEYGQSGLTNTLGPSNLTLNGINIQDRQAFVYLSGTVMVSGVCDVPRIQAQLEQVALQYNTVDTVTVFINGQPLAAALQ